MSRVAPRFHVEAADIARLEAFLDDHRPHAGGLHDLWLDEIRAVTRLPNPSPPEPSRRTHPPDPNAPTPQ